MDKCAAGTVAETVEQSAQMGDPVRVLVVDDEPAIRHAVESVLVDEGFVVTTASDGAAALSVLDSVSPDAILLDLRMPVMDGYAFLTAYRSRPEPRAAVIVCSTSPRSSITIGQGATAYLRKPFDIDDLISLIHRLAAARRKSAGELLPDAHAARPQAHSGTP